MHPSITIVPIGPNSPSLLTLASADLLRTSPRLILRTDHHPVAAWLRAQNLPFTSLDDLYESTEDFDSLYHQMAARLLELCDAGPLVYAVPDPLTDRSVDELFSLCPDASTAIRVLPGVSAADEYLAAARSALRDSGVRVTAASALSSFAYDPSLPLLITELDSSQLAGDVKILLSDLLDDESPVYFLQGRDQGAPTCARLYLYELDRRPSYDHRSAVFLPGAPRADRSRYTLRDLEEIMELLRAPDGCPWDSIQTHDSLKPYLVEEAWEAVSAIDDGDMDHLADELGDVLLQIVFHASIARAFDEFTLTDVTTHISRKMIQRHPHVFGDNRLETATQVSDLWETIKRRETGSKTVADSLEDVSPGLPSLKYAIKVQKKAMQLPGFRRDPSLIRDEIRDLSARLLTDDALDTDTLGSLLLRCTELTHRCGQDAEILLHEAVDRYKSAFRAMHSAALSAGKSPETLTFQDLRIYFKKP